MTALTNDTNYPELIQEQHRSYLGFNVMPGKPVEETLHVQDYILGDRYIEQTGGETARGDNVIVRMRPERWLSTDYAKEFEVA